MNIDHHHHPSNKPQWSSVLCSCGDDIPACCMTCWLPCVTFGQIAEIVDEDRSSCFAQGCIYGMLMLISWQCLASCHYRGKIRAKYGLPEEPCNDFCVHICCHLCALCQEYAELKHRGLDPSKGWIGPPSTPRMPPMPPSMSK